MTPQAVAAIKTEIAGATYATMTDAQVAAALVAPTPITQDVSAGDVEAIIVPTGELYAINQLAAKAPSGASPPTTADEAIATAWNFARMIDRWPIIQTSLANVWASVQSAFTALQTAGVLSSTSISTITALVKTTTTRAAQIGAAEFVSLDAASQTNVIFMIRGS